MGWTVLLVLIAIGTMTIGVVLTKQFGAWLIRRRTLQVEALAERGPTFTSDLLLRVGLLIFWLGATIGALSLFPLLVWILSGDREALDASWRLALFFPPVALIASLIAWPGMRIWILEEDRLTQNLPGRERHIEYDAMTSIAEARNWPTLVVRSTRSRMRISKQVNTFDDLFNRLHQAAPHAVAAGRVTDAESPRRPDETVTWSVPRRRFVLIFGFLGALLVFFWAWPWFLVTGDHPTRDSLIFMGIGTVMWLGIWFLVRAESFHPKKPVLLELRPASIAVRFMRHELDVRDATELVSASVETDIIYVKGQPGYRYPLRLRFTDGTTVEIDEFRARQYGTSSHRIGTEIRHRYLDPTQRTTSDRTLADVLLEEARIAEAAGNPQDAIGRYRKTSRGA